MTDREMLELAAKAAGYGELRVLDDSSIIVNCRRWNPLADDGDALRLAVKLGLDLLRTERDIEAIAGLPPYASMKRDVPAPFGIELLGDNAYAATRRAIVCAAAEIGKGMT